MELCHGRFMLDIRNRFFPQRLVEHWNRLPREWSWPQAVSLRELRHMVRIVGAVLCSAGLGAGLDLSGSLPAEDIL